VTGVAVPVFIFACGDSGMALPEAERGTFLFVPDRWLTF
jgi:hypothetical protein